MDITVIGVVEFTGLVALVWFAIFAMQYRDTRDPYVRTWSIAWAAYCLRAGMILLINQRPAVRADLQWAAKFGMVCVAWALFRSMRASRRDLVLRRIDWAILAAGALWALLDVVVSGTGEYRPLHAGNFSIPYLSSTAGIGAMFAYTAWQFSRRAVRQASRGFAIMTAALSAWAALVVVVELLVVARQLGYVLAPSVGRGVHVLSLVPEVLLGIGMLAMLFERQRRSMQQNLLAFSRLEVERGRLLAPREIAPALEKFLDRLMRISGVPRAALSVSSTWRGMLPAVQRNIAPELAAIFEQGPAADFLADLAWHRGGMVVYRTMENGWSGAEQEPTFNLLRRGLTAAGMSGVVILGVYSRERRFGTIIFPLRTPREIGDWQLRMIAAAGIQVGLTLENQALMHDAQRRTKEYEMLTQIGQAISRHLDPDKVMLTVQRELGQLFDTSNFYVAYLDGETVRFALDVVSGVAQAKRSRAAINGLTEYVIHSGQPLLIRSEMKKRREQLGCVVAGAPAKSMVAVPIVMQGKPWGMMAALHYDREFAFSGRDLEVLNTAAGQVAVAMENAKLFGEEQRRARYLAFLNNVSKTAISSQNADQMLDEIVGEIQKNFEFDHIGVGILDYGSKEIEIKAEAGTTATVLGRRVLLGTGIAGRVARTNEVALIQDGSRAQAGSLLGNAKSVFCMPIVYGESLLGVLNIESLRSNAFEEQECLILRTLADLLATALHNSFIFQKLEQQAITDSLTGIKTRRFFLEALQSEWKRATRSGRPFSVVLVDLDKFKNVNDTLGHLEGDLVLARVGRLLEQKCRQSNVVARYGGDEFVILMPETGLEQAQALSERLRLWMATDPTLTEHRVTGSFGVGCFPLHGATAEDIIRVADAGMYVSKHGGGNRVATVDEFAELGSSHRQFVTAFIEDFLQRERVGPELCDELLATLRKLAAAAKPDVVDEAVAEAVLMLARAAESREMHAGGHGDDVARIAELIGRGLDLTQEERKDLLLAARIHDVGKILIPERVLNNHEQLSDDELELLRLHAPLGAQICAAIPGGARIQKFVRHHHERFDGNGYPDSLTGEEIPLGARIIGVAEAYANFTADFPYRPALSGESACRELEKDSGTRFDPVIVSVLIRELRGERSARVGA